MNAWPRALTRETGPIPKQNLGRIALQLSNWKPTRRPYGLPHAFPIPSALVRILAALASLGRAFG
jgi:hypothetical protein